MKLNFIEEIRAIFEQAKNWAQLEVEYAKLTLAEKVTMLLSALVLGFVCLLLTIVVLILLAFALSEAFRLIMDPALAYLSSAGCMLVLLGLVFLLRRPLLLNPFSRLMTKVLFDKKH
ncbi:MAG: phage holin family protein [Muribaculaceae bacterium]|nr:phage holin family protein [Muribaculaceae bacterium]